MSGRLKSHQFRTLCGIIAGLMAVALVTGFVGTGGIPHKLEAAFKYVGDQLDKVKTATP